MVEQGCPRRWIAALLLSLPSVPGEAQDSSASPNPQAPPRPTANPDPAALDSVRRTSIAPFLEARKGGLGTASAQARLRAPLRVALEEMRRSISDRVQDLAARQALEAAARGELVLGLAAEIGGADARAVAQSLVDSAAKEALVQRTDRLHRGIICWCPNENWTKTLAGCAEGCAEPQKSLVRDWLRQGRTEEEILQAMVAQAGPRVLSVPAAAGTNWIGYLAPFALLAVAAAIVAVALLRARTRGTPPSPRTPAGEPGATRAGEANDAEWGLRIERDLKEMER